MLSKGADIVHAMRKAINADLKALGALGAKASSRVAEEPEGGARVDRARWAFGWGCGFAGRDGSQWSCGCHSPHKLHITQAIRHVRCVGTRLPRP